MGLVVPSGVRTARPSHAPSAATSTTAPAVEDTAYDEASAGHSPVIGMMLGFLLCWFIAAVFLR